jgi:hypothetical protein
MLRRREGDALLGPLERLILITELWEKLKNPVILRILEYAPEISRISSAPRNGVTLIC